MHQQLVNININLELHTYTYVNIVMLRGSSRCHIHLLRLLIEINLVTDVAPYFKRITPGYLQQYVIHNFFCSIKWSKLFNTSLAGCAVNGLPIGWRIHFTITNTFLLICLYILQCTIWSIATSNSACPGYAKLRSRELWWDKEKQLRIFETSYSELKYCHADRAVGLAEKLRYNESQVLPCWRSCWNGWEMKIVY